MDISGKANASSAPMVSFLNWEDALENAEPTKSISTEFASVIKVLKEMESIALWDQTVEQTRNGILSLGIVFVIQHQ